MKQIKMLMFCLMLLQTTLLTARNDKSKPPVNSINTVSVAAAPETEALAATWIEEFRMANPGREVKLTRSDKASMADIQIITGNSPGFMDDAAGWKIVVGRDVIVPVMSMSDPFQAIISRRGISPGEFAGILSSDGSFQWGRLLGNENTSPVTVLIPDDNALLSALSVFAKMNPELCTASRSSYTAGLSSLLHGKPGSIAFCRLADITGQDGQEFIAGISVIPIDVNSNAKSDYFEQFYADYSSFSRGVYIGKYPKALCNSIYAVSAAAPSEGAPSELISYILADGQQILAGKGFTALARGEANLKREALASARAVTSTGGKTALISAAWLWLLAVITAVSLMAYAIYLFTRARNKENTAAVKAPMSSFNLRSLVAPAGLLYDKSHSWSFMEKDGNVRVGIDDLLQHVTGSITRVVMKIPGDKIRKGEQMLSVIQNGKKLNIQSPVSGTIVARNERLKYDTSIINSSPYDDGWVYAIEPDNWEKESRFLIIAGRYLEYLKEEFARIRDFLAQQPGVNDVRYAQVVLQDGGEFKDGLLEEFGPEIWEEFQNRFLDMPR